MVSGSATVVGTVSGAVCIAGEGDGAVDLHIGVVGVESASVSMSMWESELSCPGEGVVRSRTLVFFFFLLGFEMLSGDGFKAFGVQITD